MAVPAPRPSERAATVLRRVVGLAARLVRGLSTLAVVAAGAVGLAWLAWTFDAPPEDADEWFGRLIVLGVVLSPSAVLMVFLLGLRSLRELPARLTSLPADVRSQVGSPGGPRAGRRSGAGGVLGLVTSLFGLLRLAVSSRDVLSPYAVISIALRPAILLAALGAVAAALLEIPLALIALVAIVLT
jgi:hypothetical protein